MSTGNDAGKEFASFFPSSYSVNLSERHGARGNTYPQRQVAGYPDLFAGEYAKIAKAGSSFDYRVLVFPHTTCDRGYNAAEESSLAVESSMGNIR
ncbi:hypothetical protein Tco_0137870 [Tanacetum coccineum]